MNVLEGIQDYSFYSQLDHPSTVSDSVSFTASFVLATGATPTLSDPAFPKSTAFSFIPAKGFFATLMNGFASEEATLSSNSTTDSGFILTRLARSFLSAVKVDAAAESSSGESKLYLISSYVFSPFAILCIGMALLLNRTVVFATTRRAAPMDFKFRFLLRGIAIANLIKRLVPLISALACVPDSSIAQYIPKYFVVDICPSSSILWNLYWGICLGHFIETFSSSIQGEYPRTDTGMTLFEFSLAFQEMQAFNQMSSEGLLFAINSTLTLITMHICGMFNLFRFRLIPSSFFGTIFLSYFGWSVIKGTFLKFPLVCIVGYFPHFILASIILACELVYLLSLVIVSGGRHNLAASWSAVDFTLKDDFYQFLYKVGIVALSATSEATFSTETQVVHKPAYTWVETKALTLLGKRETMDIKKRMAPMYLLPPLTSLSDEQLQTISKAKNKVRSPYGKETLNPPDVVDLRARKTQLKDRPKFTTLHRLKTTVAMFQDFFFIIVQFVFNLVWSLGLKYVLGNRVKKEVNESIEPVEGSDTTASTMDEPNTSIGNIYNSTIPRDYKALLWGRLIADSDSSLDYVPDDEDFTSDEEYFEYESDSEQEVISGASSSVNYGTHVNSQRHTGQANNNLHLLKLKELLDLMIPSSSTLVDLLCLESPAVYEQRKMLSVHLDADRIGVRKGPVTRSQYAAKVYDESERLIAVMQERRPKTDQGSENDEPADVGENVCVVCHTDTRNIILWPCRCLALCDDCRVSLMHREFKGCVCCRRPVESFSRIYVP